MTKTEVVAEGFLQAIKALPRLQKSAVISRIAHDDEFAEDIADMAVFASRRNEPSRSFQEFLSEKRKK
ncbi:MAG: hypothetical protein NTX50_02120 [Candidatus Sumerlaeota bacterium]|nr:hypothetical protein [Candidatus Sumerlaeota bacterium]